MNRLRELRENNNLTQDFIRRKIGCSQTNYSKYELGRVNVPLDVLMKLAKYYNTSTDYILGLTNNKNPYEK